MAATSACRELAAAGVQQRPESSVRVELEPRDGDRHEAARALAAIRHYSDHGGVWDYFPHDHARSRAYRWGEDGIAGICDRFQLINVERDASAELRVEHRQVYPCRGGQLLGRHTSTCKPSPN